MDKIMSNWDREAAMAIAFNVPFFWIETRTPAGLGDVYFIA